MNSTFTETKIKLKFDSLPSAKSMPNRKVQIHLVDKHGNNFYALISSKEYSSVETEMKELLGSTGILIGTLGAVTAKGVVVFGAKLKTSVPQAIPELDFLVPATYPGDVISLNKSLDR